jgi:hypothetical protein
VLLLGPEIKPGLGVQWVSVILLGDAFLKGIVGILYPVMKGVSRRRHQTPAVTVCSKQKSSPFWNFLQLAFREQSIE